MKKKIEKEKYHASFIKYTTGAGCITPLAVYLLMKKGNYRAALLLYQKGGGGLNVYQLQTDGKSHRRFAIDYHPFWNKDTKQSEWKLHYHRGENYQELKNWTLDKLSKMHYQSISYVFL